MIKKRYFNFGRNDWDECNADFLLVVIKDCYQIIYNPNISFFEKIDAYRCLWEALQTKKQDELKIEIQRDEFIPIHEYDEFRKGYTYEWFRICRDTDNKDINFYFSTKTIKGKRIDREVFLSRLVWRDDGKLSEFFGENDQVDSAGRLYLQYLIDWFLKRYDLSTATKLICSLSFKKENYSKGFWKTIGENLKYIRFVNLLLPILLVATIVLLKIYEFEKFGFTQEVWNRFCAIYGDLRCFSINSNLFTTLLAWAYPLFIVLMIFSLFKKLSVWLKLLIPRMAAGIVVGYIPLLLTDDSWRTIYYLTGLQGILLFVIVIAFSGFFLFLEVQKIVNNTAVAAVRALPVLCLGLLESFIIGLVVLDLITLAFKPTLPALDSLRLYDGLVHGLFGDIPPKILVLFFPLAFFIGIFIQLLWEEKPVTQPL